MSWKRFSNGFKLDRSLATCERVTSRPRGVWCAAVDASMDAEGMRIGPWATDAGQKRGLGEAAKCRLPPQCSVPGRDLGIAPEVRRPPRLPPVRAIRLLRQREIGFSRSRATELLETSSPMRCLFVDNSTRQRAALGPTSTRASLAAAESGAAANRTSSHLVRHGVRQARSGEWYTSPVTTFIIRRYEYTFFVAKWHPRSQRIRLSFFLQKNHPSETSATNKKEEHDLVRKKTPYCMYIHM